VTTTITLDPALPRMSMDIDANLFRIAALAVLPHVEDLDEVPAINRIRIAVDDDILLSGTNRFSAVLVKISPEQLGDDWERPSEPWSIDLNPGDVAQVCKLFKPGKDQTINLRVDWRADGRVTFTDSSGLFDGKAFTIPTVGHPEDFPNLHALVQGVLMADRTATGIIGWPASNMRRFATTAALFDGVLQVEPMGKSFLVTCGPNVIGVMTAARNDDEATDHVAADRAAWLERITR
jgi:hypothetical protein